MTAINLLGQQFDRLTVTGRAGSDRHRRPIWRCVCQCGAEVSVLGQSLRSGSTRSCGCLYAETRSAIGVAMAASRGRCHDLVGTTWGWLRVTERVGTDSRRHVTWRCICDCGTEIVLRTQALRTQGQRSCGCRTDALRSGRLPIHGMARRGQRHPLYATWCSMIARCENTSQRRYSDYGGRGITVCERWRDSFPTFLADMGERPALGMSIDRIDNDGHYEPGNVRWATAVEQNRNKRNSIAAVAS